MVDLARWLGECLDEDERIARAATPGPWGQVPERVGWLASEEYWSVVDCSGTPTARENAEHVAVWDPARVLREIDAKRRIMECHEPWVADNGDIICGRCGREHIEGRPGAHFPCQTLRLLALPYAGRDDYREEWAP